MSNYLKIVNKNKNKTIFVFSSANVPEGKFTGSKIFSEDWNVILINTKDNDWYLRDVLEGISRLSSLEHLVERYRKMGPVVFFGSSMGACGALYYGSRCNADYVFSFSPELKLGIRGGFFERECKIRDTLEFKIDYIDLIKDTDSKIYFFCGENNIVDSSSLSLVPDQDNLFKFSLINAEHVVVKEINDIFGLSYFISSIVSGGGEVDFQYLITGELLKYPCVIESLYQFDIEKNYESILNVDLNIKSKEVKSYVFRRLALYYSQQQLHEQALMFARDSYLLNANCGKNAMMYSKILFRNKKYNKVLSILSPVTLQASVELGKPYFQAYFIILDCCKKLKYKKEYFFYYYKLSKIVPINGALAERFSKYDQELL
ncbi:hypothetical protein [Leucothrix arctica]|uniref:Alpha/beta hydrolase n=1 Tax=Leucothrix arctica TaxID=1481894 RepID=A0A317CKH1_9GAMM|nr:hypothetical protein [Leucothrix arctica]PWQ98687.1 hypothetical protein DKT75_02435 [Leucothrix arctica]